MVNNVKLFVMAKIVGSAVYNINYFGMEFVSILEKS